MAQEPSGLRTDDKRPEVRSDRDEGLADTSITAANAEDDERLALSTDETTEDSETAEETHELRQNIEDTRASMGQTIDAIQERLSISNISEQVSEQVSNAIESAKDSVYEATIGKVANLMKETGRSISSSNIGRNISSNPWPYALIGAGAAWLVYDSMSGGSKRRRYYGNGRSRYGERNYLTSRTGDGEDRGMLGNATESVSNAASSAYGTVASTASGAMGTVSNTASQTYHKAADVAGQTYNKAADMAGRAYDRVGEYGHMAQDKYEEYVETKPLAVAAAAVAVGGAIGFAKPPTRYERGLLGGNPAKHMKKSRDTANQLMDKAKEVAGEAGAVIKDEISSATETAGSTGATRPGNGT